MGGTHSTPQAVEERHSSAMVQVDRAVVQIERLKQSEERYRQVAAVALAEAHTSRKESEQLRETQTLLFGTIGVLGVGTLVAAGLAVAARRSQGAALEAAAKQLTEARRRTTIDVESANKFGVSKFAKDVLDVADNLSRAAECVPVEARASDAQPALKALYEGVVMTDAVLLKTFEKHGASSSARLSGPPPTYTYSPPPPTHPTPPPPPTHTSPTHTSSTHHPLPHTHTPESMPASHCHPRAHPQPSLAWQVS
jgi:molecular chaperone GrpE (heat shock protein)